MISLILTMLRKFSDWLRFLLISVLADLLEKSTFILQENIIVILGYKLRLYEVRVYEASHMRDPHT